MQLKLALLIVTSVLGSVVDVGTEIHDSVWNCLNNNPQTKEFARLLSKPEYQDMATLLSSHDDRHMYTILAPNNDAMSQMANLNNITEVGVRSVILYHILPGLVSGSMINSLHFAPSSYSVKGHIQGMKLARIPNGQIQTSSGPLPPSNVINPDNPSSNGIVHVIDRIMVPPYSVSETLKRANLSRFLTLANHSKLLAAMDKPSGGSVFSPTNEALEDYAKSHPKFLDDDKAITSLVKQHFAPNQVKFSSRVSSSASTSLSALTGSIRMSRDAKALSVNSIPIKQADLITQFGVLHILEGIMSEKSDSASEIKDPKSSNSISEIKDSKSSNSASEIKDTKLDSKAKEDTPDTKKPKTSHSPSDTESKPSNSSSGSDDTKKPESNSDVKTTKPSKSNTDIKEVKQSKSTPESKDTNQSKPNSESQATNPSESTLKPQDTNSSKSHPTTNLQDLKISNSHEL